MARTRIDGRTVAYVDSGGDGLPLVLIHAFPFDSRMWSGQVDAFGDRCRVVALDLMGFGGSDAPTDPGRYSIEGFADDVEHLLEELDIGRAVVVGCSMGAWVALAHHDRHADRVAGLVLVAARAGADAEEVVQMRTDQQSRVLAGGLPGLLEQYEAALLSEASRRRDPGLGRRAAELMRNPVAGFVGGLEAMKHRPDWTARLGAISVPTLVIVGEHDAIAPPALSEEIHAAIPGSRLAVLSGVGMLPSLEAREAFDALLGDFLDSVGPGPVGSTVTSREGSD